MSWFVQLTLKSGDPIYVRPEMVKAVYEKSPILTNIVVDGHDYDVQGSVTEILNAVQYRMAPEEL